MGSVRGCCHSKLRIVELNGAEALFPWTKDNWKKFELLELAQASFQQKCISNTKRSEMCDDEVEVLYLLNMVKPVENFLYNTSG